MAEITGQLNLFDMMGIPAQREPEGPELKKLEELKEWAFLYTGGASGAYTGIRFMMTLEDAKKWCSSELSHGQLHGNPWAYFYTSVWNFCYCHWGQIKGTELDLRRLKDNGQWDERIAGLGLKKYDKYEIKEILAKYGISVITIATNIPGSEFAAKHPEEAMKMLYGDDY